MVDLEEEGRTVERMIGHYCRAHHGGAPFCPECLRLALYARKRLSVCRWGREKPTCAKCPTHCYAKDMRESMRTVMRYVGPRMIFLDPALCLRHLVRGLRKA